MMRMSKTKTKTVEPTPEVEEINPLEMIASLNRDLQIAQASLRKIISTNPALFKGGPSNQYFGRRHEQAFESCRSMAFEALKRMENHPDGYEQDN